MSIISLLLKNGMSGFPNIEHEKHIAMEHSTIHNPDIKGDMSATEKNVKSSAYEKIKQHKDYVVYNNQRFDKLRDKPINGDFLKNIPSIVILKKKIVGKLPLKKYG